MTNEFIDNIIRNYMNNYKSKNCITSIFKRRLIKLKLLSNYINNRFKDSESWTETIWRIRNNVINKPCCKECGKILKFPFKTYCSRKCRSNNKDVIKKTKETNLEKYGNEYNIIRKDVINKTQEKRKLKMNNIVKKIKLTKFEKYGDEHYNNKEKNKQTKLERYGDSGFSNQEKREKTNLEKYGYKCSLQNENILKKSKNTKLEKYGDEHYVNPEKIKQTCLKKYGVNNVFKNKETKEKIKNTCLNKYGDENYRNPEKHKQTCLEKYGVNSYTQTKEFKENVNWPNVVDKVNETKHKNNSFNTSKPELESYDLLKQKYPDVLHQYKDKKRYPFNCDFYIPSLDIFIECQYGQFHCGRPYLGTEKDLKDIEILKQNAERRHKETNKNKSQYDSKIYTWCILDVKKRNIAKENNLNYIEFWNINELKQWLNLK